MNTRLKKPEILVKYHNEDLPRLKFVDGYKKSCCVDLYTQEDITIKAGQCALIKLGVSIELPKGHIALLIPRSSTFKKYGLIQANSIGVIDESYCGDDDVYAMPVIKPIMANDLVLAMTNTFANTVLNKDQFLAEIEKAKNEDNGQNKDFNEAMGAYEIVQSCVMEAMSSITIPKGTRLCQIHIQRRMPKYKFKTVKKMRKENRDGFGSTGK